MFLLSEDDKQRLLMGGVAGMIEVFAAHGHHFAKDVFGSLFYFDSSNWVRGGDSVASKLCCEVIDTLGQTTIKWTPSRDSALNRRLQVTSPQLWSEAPQQRYVNLQNGIFDLEKRKIVMDIPQPDKWLWPIQLPITFNPKAKAKHWPNFISEVFPADAEELAWQIPCWLLLPGMSSEQRSLVFAGVGANGKSVCLDCYTNFLGQRNVTDFPLHELQNNRFASRYLLYKLVNICPELPSRKIETEFFKTLVGQGTIMAELKGGAIERIKPFCKILCSTNGAVRSHDDTDAFYRRLLPISFNNKFEVVPGVRERLIGELTSQGEMSGLFNRCIEVYQGLTTRGLFTPGSSQSLNTEYQQLNSPIYEWGKLMLKFEPSAGGLTSEEMYKSYYTWRQHPDQYRRYGEVKEVKQGFCQFLSTKFPSLKVRPIWRNGKTVRVYPGVRFFEVMIGAADGLPYVQ